MSRRLSDTDHKTWARVARTVKPLRGRRAVQPDAAPAQDDAEPSIPNRMAPTPPPKPAPRKAAPPADISTQRRIRRGQAEIEARLDLHGHTQDSAWRALVTFLALSRANGMRCVLVITGKGRLGTGVLRARFLDWLSGSDLRDLVSGYSAAHVRHGGDGAFYVMLRRDKPRT
jgi:DNA-nicking Smr family endonuclease